MDLLIPTALDEIREDLKNSQGPFIRRPDPDPQQGNGSFTTITASMSTAILPPPPLTTISPSPVVSTSTSRTNNPSERKFVTEPTNAAGTSVPPLSTTSGSTPVPTLRPTRVSVTSSDAAATQASVPGLINITGDPSIDNIITISIWVGAALVVIIAMVVCIRVRGRRTKMTAPKGNENGLSGGVSRPGIFTAFTQSKPYAVSAADLNAALREEHDRKHEMARNMAQGLVDGGSSSSSFTNEPSLYYHPEPPSLEMYGNQPPPGALPYMNQYNTPSPPPPIRSGKNNPPMLPLPPQPVSRENNPMYLASNGYYGADNIRQRNANQQTFVEHGYGGINVPGPVAHAGNTMGGGIPSSTSFYALSDQY